jgi:RNA polymerase sigma-54 factor
MKQSLQLRLGQSLTMTPQLQQAIKLLQLSTLDLQQEIQQVLDSNMMLEMADEERTSFGEAQEQVQPERETSDYGEIPNLDEPADIPKELAVDSSWDDVYDSPQSYTASGSGDGESDDFVFQRAPAQTLQDHLYWQMELTPFSDQDRAVATTIIDAIDDDGYLMMPIEEIHQGLTAQLEDLELDEVQAVLHRIQHFDPTGVGAAGLADCLAIQLRQLPDSEPDRDAALELVSKHLDLLAKKDLTKLKRELNVDDAQLAHIVALIRTMDPKPGRQIENHDSQYVIPDVFVSKLAGEWVVSLNPDIAPKLRINPFYSTLIKRADQSADNVCMKNHLQEARWFIKSLQSRNETLIKVARAIVDHQKAFLEHGDRAMKPLVLRDVAEEVSMHESTISRVTTQKYMHTPNGIYEFKYFFSSHVSTDEGGECSATAIKAYIKEIVDAEDTDKPLSDHTISAMLKERGINVARRTIAKYREALSIPPSNERKRVF